MTNTMNRTIFIDESIRVSLVLYYNISIKKFNLDLFYYVLNMHEGKVKSSQPSLHETRDKRLLGRDPDKSCSHRHTSVKLFWLETWAATKKALHWCRDDTSSCPNPTATCPEFHLGYRVG